MQSREETYDGLIITEEGTSTRAHRGRLNFLFCDRTIDAVIREYRESVDLVRSRMSARRELLTPAEMTDEEFGELTQELALHAMYSYVAHQKKVEITDADIDHPQSIHRIWTFFLRKHGKKSPAVSRPASVLSGMSEAEFEQWLVGWKRYLDK